MGRWRCSVNPRLGACLAVGCISEMHPLAVGAPAAAPSPKNWKWFIVPVTAGTHSFQVFVEAPVASASVGVFLRGTVEANNAPAPVEGAVFPVWRATARPWSATLVPLQVHGGEEPAGDASTG